MRQIIALQFDMLKQTKCDLTCTLDIDDENDKITDLDHFNMARNFFFSFQILKTRHIVTVFQIFLLIIRIV